MVNLSLFKITIFWSQSLCFQNPILSLQSSVLDCVKFLRSKLSFRLFLDLMYLHLMSVINTGRTLIASQRITSGRDLPLATDELSSCFHFLYQENAGLNQITYSFIPFFLFSCSPHLSLVYKITTTLGFLRIKQ